MRIILFVLILIGVFSTGAEARSRQTAHHPMCNVTMPCDFSWGPAVFKEARRVARGERVVKAMGGFGSVRHHDDPIPQVRYKIKRVYTRVAEKVAGAATQMLPHPEGCPRSAFCGCGAAVRVFGHSVRELWLAANWFKFPRTSPAPGMVAVSNHHVFVLEQHLGGYTWLAYDANSGGHATRIHARSIAGYQIVNPHGSG